VTPVRARRHLNVALSAGVAVFGCGALVHPAGLALGLAYLAPAAFVFVLLWLGRFPGERLLMRCSRSPIRRRAATAAAGRLVARSSMPRGGCLIASSLADRAPPRFRLV